MIDICYREEANIAVTITDTSERMIVGILYFNIKDDFPLSEVMECVARYYPEFSQINFQWNINKVRNGKRIGA